MNKITLRIADLRKKSRVTQQELTDNIGVSFQTISKLISRFLFRTVAADMDF